jgi:hypothetical protein
MPYKIIKKPNGKYKVKNLDSGKIISKDTTMARAKKQIALIGMVDARKKKKK